MNDPYREASPPIPPEGNPAARAVIAQVLTPGESLLWAGQPKQGIRFSLTDLFLIPFFCLWGGGALVFESMMIYLAVTGGPLWGVAYGLPFAALGLYMLVGRFFYDRAKRARTFYGVTDQRALIVQAGRRKRSETSVDFASQQVITLSEASGGRGTIHFGPGTPEPAASGLPERRGGLPPMFFRIENARAVHDRIRDAAAARRAPRVETRVRVGEAPEIAESDTTATKVQGLP